LDDHPVATGFSFYAVLNPVITIYLDRKAAGDKSLINLVNPVKKKNLKIESIQHLVSLVDLIQIIPNL
jgi:hypothetical protein